MRKSIAGTTLPTGNICVRKLSPNGVLGDRVAKCREAQLIWRRRGRIIGQPRLYGVEHHRSLGQARSRSRDRRCGWPFRGCASPSSTDSPMLGPSMPRPG